MAPKHRLYSAELAETILEQIADGKSLRSICEVEGMPSRGAVQHWIINDHEGFAIRYARARDAGLMTMADDVIAMADMAKDSDSAAAARVQVDARKWTLAKLMPNTYGDRVEVTHKGDLSKVPDAGLDQRLDALLAPRLPLIEGTATTIPDPAETPVHDDEKPK